jgi:hypothetical protein
MTPQTAHAGCACELAEAMLGVRGGPSLGLRTVVCGLGTAVFSAT